LAFYLVDVDHPVAVEYGEIHRLVRLLGKFPEKGSGLLAKTEPYDNIDADLEEFKAVRILVIEGVLIDVAEIFDGGHNTMDRTALQGKQTAHFSNSKLSLSVQKLDNRESAFYGLDSARGPLLPFHTFSSIPSERISRFISRITE